MRDRVTTKTNAIQVIGPAWKFRDSLPPAEKVCTVDFYPLMVTPHTVPSFCLSMLSERIQTCRHVLDFPCESWSRNFWSIYCTLWKFSSMLNLQSERRGSTLNSSSLTWGEQILAQIPSPWKVSAFLSRLWSPLE